MFGVRTLNRLGDASVRTLDTVIDGVNLVDSIIVENGQHVKHTAANVFASTAKASDALPEVADGLVSLAKTFRRWAASPAALESVSSK